MSVDVPGRAETAGPGEPAAVKAKTAQDAFSAVVVYTAFLMVGGGCGWFVVNALWQVVANEPRVQQGGAMMGTITLICGYVGLGSAFLYLLYMVMCPERLSLRAEQRGTALLIVCTIATFALLMGWWDVGAPGFPVIICSAVFGNLVSNTTMYLVFPLISTYYGGWLIAPVRAGTDISSLTTTLLAEAQNPSGVKILFPSWVLFLVYMLLSCVGLAAWAAIVQFGIGLRAASEPGEGPQDGPQSFTGVSHSSTSSLDAEAQRSSSQADAKKAPSTVFQRVLGSLRGLACPKQFISPVIQATIAQVLQWALVMCIGQVGALMTDPIGCQGDRGNWVYRTALTLSSALVPVGSVVSSLIACPRWTYSILSLVQMLCATVVCLTVAGVARQEATSTGGQYVYIGSFALVGGLEGYLVTMAYRYIGDAEEVPLELRRSASSLLSFLGVVFVNPFSIVFGTLVNNGTIACHL